MFLKFVCVMMTLANISGESYHPELPSEKHYREVPKKKESEGGVNSHVLVFKNKKLGAFLHTRDFTALHRA